MKVLVTGAGGFIGSHLVTRLKADGHKVLGVDVHYPEFSKVDADQFEIHDLRSVNAALSVMDRWKPDYVYALAADMGGMGYISQNHARIIRNNLLINLNTLEAARDCNVRRYFFSSSACVYPEFLQNTENATKGLREEEAYPAQPQDAYGWEKLTTERILNHYAMDYHMDIRIARFHNIYGPKGTWQGGREKAPAAFCRKIAAAKLRGERQIEIWGDGYQTRSFCYIDDCINGVLRLMESNYAQPVNIGSEEMVTINQLAEIIGSLAGWLVELIHVPGPQGVRGRNSNNDLVREVLGWTPEISLYTGLASTYLWIEEQLRASMTVTV